MTGGASRWAAARVTAALAVAVLAGCDSAGAGAPNPLRPAEAAMSQLDAGHIDMQLTGSTTGPEPAGPVGFRMQGRFSFRPDDRVDGTGAAGNLAVVDLRYERLLGSRKQETRVLSTGAAAFVVEDDAATPVTPADAAILRLADGEGGPADLGVAGWVRNPTVLERPGTTLVTGTVDVADLLADLARVDPAASGAFAGLDGDDTRRLERLVEHSELRAELGPDDLPRRLEVLVEFGSDLAGEVRAVLGPYSSTRLELTLSVSRLTGPLEVTPPG